jgi:carbonic anhydrase
MAVRDAWQRGQRVTVHGWIYGLRDGRISDLEVSIDSSAGQTMARNAIEIG